MHDVKATIGRRARRPKRVEADGSSRRASLGLVLALSGCIGPLMPGSEVSLENQDEAVQIIWQQCYGRADSPPEIRWVSANQQNCVDEHSGRRGFKIPFTGCVEGFTISARSVSVSWHDSDVFSVTALAHEFVHAAQARRLVFDPDHHTAEFQPGGAVDRANAMLSDSGL
jgi:hypothetical protein